MLGWDWFCAHCSVALPSGGGHEPDQSELLLLLVRPCRCGFLNVAIILNHLGNDCESKCLRSLDGGDVTGHKNKTSEKKNKTDDALQLRRSRSHDECWRHSVSPLTKVTWEDHQSPACCAAETNPRPPCRSGTHFFSPSSLPTCHRRRWRPSLCASLERLTVVY